MDPVSSVLNLVTAGVNKIFPDAGEKEKAELEALTLTLQTQLSALTTELSGNWLQRSWRPILMLSITLILINNYLLFPYLSLFGVPATFLDFPDKLWSLLTVGVGGYVVGRSAEKGLKLWKG